MGESCILRRYDMRSRVPRGNSLGSGSDAQQLLGNLDSQELLPHEDVVAMSELGFAANAQERAVLGAEIGQDEAAFAGASNAAMVARDERVVGEADVVAVATDREVLGARAKDHPDVASAQFLSELER